MRGVTRHSRATLQPLGRLRFALSCTVRTKSRASRAHARWLRKERGLEAAADRARGRYCCKLVVSLLALAFCDSSASALPSRRKQGAKELSVS